MSFSIDSVVKKRITNEEGRMVNKLYRVDRVLHQDHNFQVLNIVDLEKMQKQTLKIIVKNTDLNKNAVVNEIRNQKMVAGLPNFIGLKEVFEDNQHIYFFMDPWGKSVADVLQTRILFTERECQFLLSQLIDILDNLRTRSISHGGITLNSLFLSDNNGVNILRLGDFSHSINVVEYCNASLQAGFMHADNDLTSQNLVNLEDKRGNQQAYFAPTDPKSNRRFASKSKQFSVYTAPEEYCEQKNGMDRIQSLYDRDIWSCGVILFKCLTGLFPFSQMDEKLQMNRIKHASFVFPTRSSITLLRRLDRNVVGVEQNDSLWEGFSKPRIDCRQTYQQFLSTAWKELLKNILTTRDRRINLRALFNHPLKVGFERDNDIGILSHCVFQSLENNFATQARYALSKNPFSQKPRTVPISVWCPEQKQHLTDSNGYKQIWAASFDENPCELDADYLKLEDESTKWEGSNKLMSGDNLSKNKIEESLSSSGFRLFNQTVIKATANSSDGFQNNNSLNKSCTPLWEISNSEEEASSKKLKAFPSTSKIDTIKYDTCLRQRRDTISLRLSNMILSQSLQGQNEERFRFKALNQKDKVVYEIVANNEVTAVPSICKAPVFVTKFKYFRKEKCLGYVLNNVIGVVYADNDHVIGHNKKEFQYLQDLSQIATQTTLSNINIPYIEKKSNEEVPRKQKFSVHRRFANKNEQRENVDTEKTEKTNLLGNSKRISSSTLKQSLFSQPINYQGQAQKQSSLSAEKLQYFQKCIDHFGQRIIRGSFNLWVQSFWLDGNVTLFLMSNGCWQVAFKEKKQVRAYAIDQHELSWCTGCPYNNDIANIARNIVNRKKHQILKWVRSRD